MSGAKGLAQELARAFGGRLRRQEGYATADWPATEFLVKGTHRGSAIELAVFDGGCLVRGRGWGRDGPIFALNASPPSVEKRVTGISGLEVPVFRHGGLTSAESVRELLADPRTLRLCSDLELGAGELLLVTVQSVYLVHRSTDIDRLRKRLDLIAELVPQPKPSRVLTTTAHRIKIGRVGTGRAVSGARHVFGGTLDRPATCGNCKTPVHLLLTIDTTDPAIGLDALAPAPIRVVFCLDCMSFPSLTYVDQSGADLRIVRQMTEERHSESPALEARPLELSPLKSASGAGSKLGGSPKWIQGPEPPECTACKEPMAFLAQLASTRELSFADDGVLYTFVCEACRITASLVQSH